MRTLITIIIFVNAFFVNPAYAIYGNYGDLMLLYSPQPITDPVGVKAEREARNYEEALLHIGIPQYTLGDCIRDEALIRNEFFYHTEICGNPREYTEFWGMDWRRYRFTQLAKQMLWIGQVVAIYDWIMIDGAERYKLPLAEVQQLYIDYVQRVFGYKQAPVTLMIGLDYGQTLEEYTDFAGDSFYYPFMWKKHHYCVTATFWSIMKSLYDRGSIAYRVAVEKSLSDPRTVQGFDTLTAGRLIGMLLKYELIKEY